MNDGRLVTQVCVLHPVCSNYDIQDKEMRDMKWVFSQKQRNLRATGKTVGGVRGHVCLFSSPLSLRNAPGDASITPRGSEGNLRVGFV